MIDHSIVNTIGNFVVLSYFIPLVWFIVQYSARSPWDATELGVALLFQKIGFALVILVICLSVFFPGYFGREFFRLSAYLAVLFFLWLDVANLTRYQRRYPDAKKNYKRRSLREIFLQQFRG